MVAADAIRANVCFGPEFAVGRALVRGRWRVGRNGRRRPRRRIESSGLLSPSECSTDELSTSVGLLSLDAVGIVDVAQLGFGTDLHGDARPSTTEERRDDRAEDDRLDQRSCQRFQRW